MVYASTGLMLDASKHYMTQPYAPEQLSSSRVEWLKCKTFLDGLLEGKVQASFSGEVENDYGKTCKFCEKHNIFEKKKTVRSEFPFEIMQVIHGCPKCKATPRKYFIAFNNLTAQSYRVDQVKKEN